MRTDDRVQSLEALAAGDDVEGAREALRHYLKGGAISCTPEATGYVARAELVPLAGFLDGAEMKNAAELGGPAALSSGGCAGPQLDFPAQQFQGVAEVWVPFEEVVAVGWTAATASR